MQERAIGRFSGALLACAVALLACAPAAPGAGQLLPRRREVPGFRSAGSGASLARSLLGRRAPALLRRAPAQGVAFRAPGGRRLSLAAFPLAGRRRARRLLSAFAHREGHRVRRGTVAWRTRARRFAAMTALTVAGRAIVAVRLRVRRGDRSGTGIASRAYLRQLSARVERVLGMSAWQRTLSRIGPDGSVTPRLALRAFAIAYGSLPGVSAPTRRRGNVPDGTLAIQLVAREWNHFTHAQQAAIDRSIGAPHDARAPPPAARTSKAPLTPQPAYDALAAKYAAIYRSLIPGAPTPLIRVFTSPEVVKTKKGEIADMEALSIGPHGEWNGPPIYCQVRVLPAGQAEHQPFFGVVLAHEVFHCFEYVLTAEWARLPDWIMEGLAEWASNTVDPIPLHLNLNLDAYREYLETPAEPLFGRSYDALGFWGWADQSRGAGSLWAKVPAILAASDSAGSYAAAVAGGGEPFADSWASSWWRYPATGPAWNESRPFAVSHSRLRPLPQTVATDAELRSPPYTLAEAEVVADPAEPLVRLDRSAGSLRAGTARTDYGTVSSSRWFCFGKCRCPQGEVSSIPPHEAVHGSELSVALTGGAGAGAGRVAYHPLGEFCESKGRPTHTHLTAAGALPATGTESGYCSTEPYGSASGSSELMCQFAMHPSSGGYCLLQLSTSENYAGSGYYAAKPTGGPTEAPYVSLGAFSPCVDYWSTDNVWDSAAEANAGGFSIDVQSHTGSVNATMNDHYEDTGTTETVQGRFTFSFQGSGCAEKSAARAARARPRELIEVCVSKANPEERR